MLKTCFVCWHTNVGSGVVRGRQIGAALRCDVFGRSEFTPELAARYEAVIYVKRLPVPALMETLSRRGILQVADALDNYDWRHFRRRADFIDAYIGSNRTHAVQLERMFGRPAVSIPHHHCNPREARIPDGRTPASIGYVGGRDYLKANQRAVRRLRLPVSFHTSFDDLERTYLALDVGFAWRDEPAKRSFNSAVKLVNFMSFGIPSVLTPETGYLELARHGEHCYFAHDRREFVMQLEHLAEDPDLRRRMGEAAYDAARPFHIGRVVEQYRAFLEAL